MEVYYKVRLSIVDFENDSNSFFHEFEFRGDDILKCREDALCQYLKARINHPDSYRGKPFVSFEEMQSEIKGLAHSLQLIFVNEENVKLPFTDSEYEYSEFEYILLGDDEELTKEAIQEEKIVYAYLGINYDEVSDLLFE